MAGQTLALPGPRERVPGEPRRRWSLTLCSSSAEEVILAEDETDGEQRHPFDGNCSEPGSGGGGVAPGGRPEQPVLGEQPVWLSGASRGWTFRAQVTPSTNTRPGQDQEDTGNGGNLRLSGISGRRRRFFVFWPALSALTPCLSFPHP